jgi:hypothetical protein
MAKGGGGGAPYGIRGWFGWIKDPISGPGKATTSLQRFARSGLHGAE